MINVVTKIQMAIAGRCNHGNQALCFRYQDKNGVTVKNLRLIAHDYSVAEKRLAEMYRYCEILETIEETIIQRDNQIPGKV